MLVPRSVIKRPLRSLIQKRAVTNNVIASAWLATYTVQGGPRLTNTIAGMFGGKGTNFSDRLSNTPFYSNSIPATFSGPDSFFIPDSLRTNTPVDATHLLLVLDPFNQIVETIETNNVLALPFHSFGIDISKAAGEPTVSDFVNIKGQGYHFVIAQGWGGKTANNHAEIQLNHARIAGLLTAGYCYLNFASSYDGARQIRNALGAFGSEAEYLGFLAIDVETFDQSQLPPGLKQDPPDPVAQAQAVTRISEAISQVELIGLEPVSKLPKDFTLMLSYKEKTSFRHTGCLMPPRIIPRI